MAARNTSSATTAAAVASLDLSALPEDDDQSVDMVSVDGYTFDQIVEHIVDAYRRGTESIISLRCPADLAWGLSARLDEELIELDQRPIRRFEYDFHSGIAYIDIMPETSLHYRIQTGTRNYAEITLARFVTTIPDPAIRQWITQEILDFGTCSIAEEGKILKQGDFAFGSVKNNLPCLVGEVSYSERRSHVERKAVQYIECTESKIRATIVFKAQYPDAKWATIALRVADGSATGSWVQYFDTIYDVKLPEQPGGQLGLYVSDFIGPAGLPTEFCRPSAAELAAGISRYASLFSSNLGKGKKKLRV